MRSVLVAAIGYLVLVMIASRRRLRELHPRRFFIETWLELDREAALARAARTIAPTETTQSEAEPHRTQTETAPFVGKIDWRPWIAYLSFAVVLTLQEYYGDRTTFYRLRDLGWVIDKGPSPDGFPEHAPHFVITGPWKFLASPRWGELYALLWWVATRGGGYILPPLLLIPIWRERYRDYGLSARGFLSHAWIYALFFGIVLIAVILVSRSHDFATYYPFYAYANRSWKDFFLWECAYAFQFFALEFYFRGFLLFSASRVLGSGVILAMVVPYCMIHFGKPVLETLAAILAGTVLGTLALKTRSIWSGFLIHVTVALSMDLAALVQGKGLPGGFRLGSGWS